MSKLRECGQKKAFRYKREAEKFAFYLKRQYLDTAHVYRCRHCSMYHLGHAKGLRRFR